MVQGGGGTAGAEPERVPLRWQEADPPPGRESPFSAHRWAPLEAPCVSGLAPGGAPARVHFRVHALTLRPEVLAQVAEAMGSDGWDRPEGFDVAPPPDQATDPSPGAADLPGPALALLGRNGAQESSAPCGRPDTLRARAAADAAALGLPDGFAPVFGCGPDAQRRRGTFPRARSSMSLGLYGETDEAAAWDPWRGPEDTNSGGGGVRGSLLRVSRAAVQAAEDTERRAHGRAPGVWSRFAEPPEGWMGCYQPGGGAGDTEMADGEQGPGGGEDAGEARATALRPHAHARATWHGTLDLLPADAWVLLAPGARPPPLTPDQVDRCFLEPAQVGPAPPASFAAVRARPGEVLLFPGWVPQCASRPLGGRMRAAAAFNYYLE